MMKYILMEQRHISAIAALEQECFSAPWSERSIEAELTNPLSLWIVAEEDGVPVGYVGSQAVMGEADMMNLAVLPSRRGEGIATGLVMALIEHLKPENSCLTLEVRASNAAAIGLYRKLGFQQIGRRPNYYSKPKEDALILRREWDV